MHMNATMGLQSYAYMLPQVASTDVSLTEALLHLHQQQLVYGQGLFPYTACSPHKDALAARYASLVSPALEASSKVTSPKTMPSILATAAPTPFDKETIARALSLITSAQYPLSSLDNGNVTHVLSQQYPLLMLLSELQRQQQQQRRAAEISVALQQQRQELCRASMAFIPRATSPQLIHYKNSFNDMPPVLERQSPKKRRHHGENPSAKRSRVSTAWTEYGFEAGNGTEAIVKGTTSPSTSLGGSAILQQLIEDVSPDEGLEKETAKLNTVDADSPHRHHPYYLPKRDPEAALLEDYATVYMLNGFGGLCANRLEKCLEEALFDTPSDSSAPSPNEYLRDVCSSDGADASPVFPRAS